jgi:hypothetical protein
MDCKQLIEAIEWAGHEARSYSGRGMYGRECVGVTVNDPFEFFAELLGSAYDSCKDDDEREGVINGITDLLRDTRTDSMGRSMIVYWPSIEWKED